MIRTLEVRLGATLVGHLTNLADDATVFAFAPEYREWRERPVLSQSFLDDSGALLEAHVHARRLAPPFFSNLLPEGGMRSIIAGHLDVSKDRDFPLLAYLGGDLVGAVRLAPAEPLAPIPSDALTFSLPGVQLKLSALLTEADALTIPVHGNGGDWIVKVSSGAYPGFTENEFSMLELARRSGIEVPETKLISPTNIAGLPPEFAAAGAALAIRRFDRADGQSRIHVEDFNQVFGQFAHDKYKNYTYGDMGRMLVRRVGFTHAREFVRRLTFNAMIGNGDMHLKNFSLIYRNGRDPELAPAYDYVSTLVYPSLDHRLALSFGDSKEPDIYQRDRIRRFAQTAELPVKLLMRDIADTIERTHAAWHGATDLPMREEHRAIVGAHIDRFAAAASRSE
ncbi:MAG: type II toxin-antitoxin system HipA family toxin [Candidatus Baltobacteraceae bacterium]